MLRGLGASIALPFLDVMEAEASQTPQRPTPRVAFLYFPNGISDGAWEPEEVGPAGELLKLNSLMSPLEAFRNDIVIPRNMWTPLGNGHGAGTATWLTGHGYDERRINVGGPSVDQIAARAIGRDTPLQSLELSLQGMGSYAKDLPRNNISWTDASTPCAREVEPRRVFDRIVGRTGGALASRSVLDLVLADAQSLHNRVSIADRRKVDEYMESIRGLERRLDFAEAQTTRIDREQRLTDSLLRPQAGIPSDHKEYVRLMMDMIVLAFWSDATRVCSFMLDHGQTNRYFDFLDGVRGTWHALSHYEDISGRSDDDDGKNSWDSVTSKREMFNEVVRWHHEQLAYLLGRLSKVKDGDVTLLDNSMLLYGSSLANGSLHNPEDIPTLIAGRGGGTITTGRALQLSELTSMSRIYLAMLQGLGVKVDHFGETRQPLEQLQG